MELVDIINDIPKILLYVVPGFITIKVYIYFSYKDQTPEFNRYTLYSIAISYMYNVIFDLIFQNYNLNIKIVCVLAFSIFLGFFLSKLNIIPISKRSGNSNIWFDFCYKTKNTDIAAKVVLDNDVVYYGFIYMVAEKDDPEIILYSYQQYKKVKDEYQLIFDYSKDNDTKYILIKTKDIKFIEFSEHPD
jgi:hypothetical protein